MESNNTALSDLLSTVLGELGKDGIVYKNKPKKKHPKLRSLERLAGADADAAKADDGSDEDAEDSGLEWPIYRPPYLRGEQTAPIGRTIRLRRPKTVVEAVQAGDKKGLQHLVATLHGRDRHHHRKVLGEGLLCAMTNSNMLMTQELLRLGANLSNLPPEEQFRLLGRVVESRNLQVLEMLLKKDVHFGSDNREVQGRTQSISHGLSQRQKDSASIISVTLDVKAGSPVNGTPSVLDGFRVCGNMVCPSPRKIKPKSDSPRSHQPTKENKDSAGQHVQLSSASPTKFPPLNKRRFGRQNSDTFLQVKGQSVKSLSKTSGYHLPKVNPTRVSLVHSNGPTMTSYGGSEIGTVALHNVDPPDERLQNQTEQLSDTGDESAEGRHKGQCELDGGANESQEPEEQKKNKFKSSKSKPWTIWRVIHMAASLGETEMLKLLLNSGTVHLDASHGALVHALFLAVQNGHTECAQVLVDMGLDVNCRDPWANHSLSPLHLAAFWGHTGVSKMLLQAGAEVTVLDGNKITPWMHAVHNRHHEVAKVLQAAEQKDIMEFPDGKSYLHLVCDQGYQRCLKPLVDKGLDLNSKDIHGNTPLMGLVKDRRLFTAKYLCDSFRGQFEINARDKAGMSALQTALEFDFDAMGKIVPNALCHAGADLNQVYVHDDLGQTPLMRHSSQLCKIEWLLRHGANPNLKDAQGHSALWYAVQLSIKDGDSVDPVLPFLEHNADMSLVDPKSGTTVLQDALKAQNVNTAEVLVSSGSSLAGVADWLETQMPSLDLSENMTTLMNWIKFRAKTVKSLLHLSRLAVMAGLNPGDIKVKVKDLEIPSTLKQYLHWDTYFKEQRKHFNPN